MRQVGKKRKKKLDYWKAIDHVPNDCGYDKKFKWDIDMHSNGIMGDCIEWCVNNCKGKWGWWFKQTDLYDPIRHNWEEQNSYMSFENKREATAFFLASGMANMGDHSR